MNQTHLYEIVHLRHSYQTGFTLEIPHLTIAKSSSLGIVGPNGSGKSTLLRLLAFLQKADSGKIYFDGNWREWGDPSCRLKVTLLCQEPYLLKRSVFNNIAYGLKVRGEKRNLNGRVNNALRLVGLSPESFSHRRWFELSRGEAQRVALASRLVVDPEVLLLDEPTANIDRKSSLMIKKAIAKVRENFHNTVIITSHDPVWLHDIADEIIRMHGGRVAGSGTDNIIEGPWVPDHDGLWAKVLPDGQIIRALKPPFERALGILSSTNIMISTLKPVEISAQNVLLGVVKQIIPVDDSERMQLEVHIGGVPFSCSVTRYAVRTLDLLPGKEVWVIFKASSVQWQ